MIPLGQQIRRSNRDTVLSENQRRIENSVVSLEEQMSKMIQMTSMMCSDREVLRLASIKDADYNVDSTIYLLRAQKKLSNYVCLLDNIDYCSLSFGKNLLFISRTLISRDYREVYGTFYGVGNLTAEDYRNKLQSNNKVIECLPECSVRTAQNVVHDRTLVFITTTALQPTMNNVCRVTYVMRSVGFMEHIAQDLLSNGGFVVLYDNEGQILTASNEAAYSLDAGSVIPWNTMILNGMNYVMFSESSREMGFTLIAGIPETLITQSTGILTRFVTWYLLTGLAISVLLCIAYAMWHYRLIKQLIDVGREMSNVPYENSNGYRYVRNILEDISSTKNRLSERYNLLDNAYMNNILVSACLHGVYTQDEKDALRVYVGELPLYYIAAVHYAEHTDSAEVFRIEMELTKKLPKCHLIPLHYKAKESILIISGISGSENAEAIRMSVADALNNVLQRGDGGHAGISDGLTGIGMLRQGYSQAMQVLHMQEFAGYQHSVDIYTPTECVDMIIGIQTLKKLSDFIYSCKLDGVKGVFQELKEQVVNTPSFTEEQCREMYYALRMALRNISRELDVQLTPAESIESYSDAMALLEADAETMVNCITVRQQRGNEALYQKINECMLRHISDAGFNASVVALELGCSEKYVFRLVKDCSGHSFGDVLESLRIARTDELLRTTDWNNEKIAESTGFASLTTFYRAFRKAHGVTPGVWRGLNERESSRKNNE